MCCSTVCVIRGELVLRILGDRRLQRSEYRQRNHRGSADIKLRDCEH
jgi:hypothetical protein